MQHILKTAVMTAGLMAAAPVSAQMVGLATTTGGATEQIGLHLATVLSDHSDLVIRPQVMANSSQYIPMVNAGRVEFGIANYPQVAHAMEGIGMSEGSANPDLRMVATILPFNAGLVVPVETGIESLADLAGQAVPRFPANSLGEFFFTAAMETGGVSYDEVKPVPTSNFGEQFNNIKSGLTDVTIGSVGAQSIMDVEASRGEVRYLSFKEGDEEILSRYLPGTSLTTWGDRGEAAGVTPDTVVLFYDYTLFAHKDVPDEVVTAALEALYTSADAARAGGALWSEYDETQLARVTTLPYHPAAEAFFRERGIWTEQ